MAARFRYYREKERMIIEMRNDDAFDDDVETEKTLHKLKRTIV